MVIKISHFKKTTFRLPWWLRMPCQCRGHKLEPWARRVPCAPKQLDLCAAAIELQGSRARERQLTCPGGVHELLLLKPGPPTLCDGRGRHSGSPGPSTGEGPTRLTAETPRQQCRPSTAKNKHVNKAIF